VQGQVQFTNDAEAAGVLNGGFGRGAAMVDFDGDGLLDLFAASTGPNSIYRQLSDGTFEEMSAAWGLELNDDPTWTPLATDFDNDGDPDLMLLVGGFVDREVEAMAFGGAGFGIEGLPNVMLRNDLDTLGVFTDVTADSGAVGTLITSVFGGVAADYDRDGDLDVFLSNQPEEQTCHLLRNDGNLFFTDVSVEAGIVHTGNFRHVGSGDIDNDGWVDFAVGNQSGPNFVYGNNGDGTFTEVSTASRLASEGDNFGLVFADFDNDGWMDAYIPKYDRVVSEPSPTLYMNNQDGTFRDVTDGSGIAVASDMGHTVADFDSDGYPDILAGTGGPLFLEEDHLYLITPDGNGGLVANDVSESAGLLSEGLTRQHGQAVGDLDGDGDLDIYANNGGPFLLKESEQDNFLWMNAGNDNHWVGLDIEGQVSNRPGVGTRIMVETASGRQIYRYRDGGRGFGNTNPSMVHVGLGSDDEIAFASFSWPSGIDQDVLALDIDQRHDIVETGMLGPDSAAIGTTYSYTIYGPAGHEVTNVWSITLSDEPTLVESRGGFVRVDPPINFAETITLDEFGVGTATLDVPDDPGVVGAVLYLQSWIREPGAETGGAMSNVISFEVTE